MSTESINSDGKKFKLASATMDDSGGKGQNCFLFTKDLPMDTVHRIVAFSDKTTRLNLCLVCKKALLVVEEHEKRVYEAIKRIHKVDTSFEERILASAPARFKRTLDGKPTAGNVPSRYQKNAAMKKHLYAITSSADVDPNQQANDMNMIFLALSPSGSRVVLMERMEDVPHVYDLEAKQYLAKLTGDYDIEDSIPYFTFANDNQIIVTLNDSERNLNHTQKFHLWTENLKTGAWTTEPLVPAGSTSSEDLRYFGSVDHWTSIGEKKVLGRAFLGLHQQGTTVLCFHLDSKEFEVKHLSSKFDLRIISAMLTMEAESKRVQFSNRFREILMASYHWKQASDCDRTFYALSKNQQSLIKYELGASDCLVETQSFRINSDPSEILAASRSYVVVAANSVQVYDSSNGRLCQELDYDTHEIFEYGALRVSGQQLLVFASAHVIKAYCIKEPSLA